MGTLHEYAADKEESLLEIAKLVPIKFRDLFLKIRKNIGSMVSLEATEQHAVTITDGDEEKSPTPKKRIHHRNGTKKVMKSHGAALPYNPIDKGKWISPYKTIS